MPRRLALSYRSWRPGPSQVSGIGSWTAGDDPLMTGFPWFSLSTLAPEAKKGSSGWDVEWGQEQKYGARGYTQGWQHFKLWLASDINRPSPCLNPAQSPVRPSQRDGLPVSSENVTNVMLFNICHLEECIKRSEGAQGYFWDLWRYGRWECTT